MFYFFVVCMCLVFGVDWCFLGWVKGRLFLVCVLKCGVELWEGGGGGESKVVIILRVRV